MRTSAKGKAIIKMFEGLGDGNKMTKGIYEPYRDQVGVWTIGYGSTYLADGSKVTKDTKPLTEAQCAELFYKKLPIYEEPVRAFGDLNQNQFDACVSLCYNIGTVGFKKSRIYKALTIGKPVTHDMFMAHNKARNQKGVVVTLPGLTRRREMEYVLFNSKTF